LSLRRLPPVGIWAWIVATKAMVQERVRIDRRNLLGKVILPSDMIRCSDEEDTAVNSTR
jgi:hypothetical protein